MGTELQRRDANTTLPLWSAQALLKDPELVWTIHGDDAASGAEILTANTFRTHARTLAKAGMGERSAELSALAIQLAHQGASLRGREIFVAGSLSPLEDCYRPDLAPDQASVEREHAAQARFLADAGVDLILAETHNSVREAEGGGPGRARDRPPVRRVVRDRRCRAPSLRRADRGSRRRPPAALPGRPRHQLRAGRSPRLGPGGPGRGGTGLRARRLRKPGPSRRRAGLGVHRGSRTAGVRRRSPGLDRARGPNRGRLLRNDVIPHPCGAPDDRRGRSRRWRAGGDRSGDQHRGLGLQRAAARPNRRERASPSTILSQEPATMPMRRRRPQLINIASPNE